MLQRRLVSALQFPIKLLQYKEGFLLLTMIGDKSFTIEIILKTRENPSRTAKVLENPWGHSAKKGDAFQHVDLVLIKVLLILLGPTSGRSAVIAKKCIASEFAHD